MLKYLYFPIQYLNIPLLNGVYVIQIVQMWYNFNSASSILINYFEISFLKCFQDFTKSVLFFPRFS